MLTTTTEKFTTVRLAPAVRSRLKILAAARSQTMESALAEAVEFWARASIGRTGGKIKEAELRRIKDQCEAIAGSGNERIIQAMSVLLDCMSVGL